MIYNDNVMKSLQKGVFYDGNVDGSSDIGSWFCAFN